MLVMEHITLTVTLLATSQGNKLQHASETSEVHACHYDELNNQMNKYIEVYNKDDIHPDIVHGFTTKAYH
eukprot:479735-Ditylum_brightwellii.AAC.1